MSPFDIQRGLPSPRPLGIGPRQLRAATLVHFDESGRVRQAKLQVELVQIVNNVGIIVSTYEGDCRTRAVTEDITRKEDLIHAVSQANLCGSVADPPVRAEGLHT